LCSVDVFVQLAVIVRDDDDPPLQSDPPRIIVVVVNDPRFERCPDVSSASQLYSYRIMSFWAPHLSSRRQC